MNSPNVCAIVEGDRSVVFDLLHPSDYIQKEIATSKTFYEKDVLEEVSRLQLEEGAVCDVGANIGNHALYFSIILGREVYAFEPLQAAYEQLVRNIRINRCEDRVRTFNVALGARNAKGTMQVAQGNLGASRFVLSAVGDTRLVTLDDSVPSDLHVALIKIDVEGLEFEVLSGATATIVRCKPMLVVEAQDHPAYVRIADLLETLGYLPLGVKGKTRTFFFVHRSKWEGLQGLGQFLIRNDLDYVSRRLHGQLDRISRMVNDLPAHPALAAKLSELSGATTEEVRRLRADLEQLARRADEAAPWEPLQQVIEGVGGSVAAVEARIGAMAQELHEGLERVRQNDGAHFEGVIGELRAALAGYSSLLNGLGVQLADATGSSQRESQLVREQVIEQLQLGFAAVSDKLAAVPDRAALGEQSNLLGGLRVQVADLAGNSRRESQLLRDQVVEQLQAGFAAVSDKLAEAPDRATLGEVVRKESARVLAPLGALPRQQDLKSVQDALLRKLEDVAGRDAELARMRSEAGDLEGEVARLLIAVQTERARAQFLSRRLNTLYTQGPRPLVGKFIRLLNALHLGKIIRHESWAEFQQRLEVRVKREVDDFKKMHARLKVQSQRPAGAAASAPSLARPGADAKALILPQRRTPAPSALPEVKRDRVRIGIASIYQRRDALAQVVEALYPQADELLVYLNDYPEIPQFLQQEKIRVIHGKGDVGDRGKFYDVENFQGYVFSCDDDIHYPPYYVRHCIDGIERYGRKAAVGWHGSAFKTPFDDYYSAESRRVFSFRAGRPEDVPVHVLGTGCTAFHSSTVKVRYEDFKTPNMADVYFALLGQQQKVPFVVLRHDAGEALPIEIPEDKAIHKESMQNTGSKADTRALQNQLVKAWPQWEAALPPVVAKRQVTTIAYVGRIEVDRWKKGGILKSSHLIIESLRALGHRVVPVEISQPIEKLVPAVKDAHVVWIYPGDPERPDFAPVQQLIEASAKAGKQVYVNLSYNLKPSRTAWIQQHLTDWKKAFGSKVKACLFTNSSLALEQLASVRSNIVSIPKSIDFDRTIRAEFQDTEGIFLGDLQKLLNRDLVGGDIEEWIAAVRAVLPDVKLYAVRQYGGKIDRELGLTVVPYTKGTEWEEWLAKRRVVCCLTPHATFEMIPVEAAGLGVPALYRPMPHAHSEALSTAGIQVQGPRQFAAACEMLYKDQALWQMYSNAGRLRAESQHIDHAAAAIHTGLVLGRL